MRLADRVAAVLPSATLAMAARAKALRAQGVSVVDLSAGEPDADTPDNIKQAAKRALDAGDTKYSPVPGSVALRQAIAKVEGQRYGRTFALDQIIVGAGGKQVIFNACVALLNPGDEAIIPSPYWVSYPDMVRFAGAKPVHVHADDAQGFRVSAKALGAAVTERTRLLVLNSPSNPTGATYSRAELLAIAEVMRRHPDVVVITDDMYGALTFDAPFVSFAHVAPDLQERTLIASGVSKTYAMTGWRIGYALGPKELIAGMSRLQGASTSGASSIAQAAAVEALLGDQRFVEEMRQTFHRRRDRMLAGLAKIDGLTCVKPGGAFYVFPRIKSYLGGKVKTSQALCEHLLDTVHLAAVPGDAFGSDDHIRLSFACSDAQIDEGVKRLRDGLSALRG